MRESAGDGDTIMDSEVGEAIQREHLESDKRGEIG